MSIEIVFNDANNPNIATFFQTIDGVTTELDFTSVTRMVVTLSDSAVVIDSDTAPNIIEWIANDGTLSSGQVRFSFNESGVVSDDYMGATLRAYDPTRPLGQIIVHMNTEKLRFLFVETT